MNSMQQYLYRVAAITEGGYVNVHHIYRPDVNKDPIFPGSACKTVEEAVQEAKYWAHRKSADVYLAMNAYEFTDGKGALLPRALRRKHNVIGCKCLYLDVDVDPNPKKDAYRTVEEMEAGLAVFYERTSFPVCTISVDSGRGGRHLYWPLNRILTPEQWEPLAEALSNAAQASGLKFDPQCTTDRTRLLRIPGTWNFKNVPQGLPVNLHQDDNLEDDPNELAKILEPWYGKIPTIDSSPSSATDAGSTDDMADDLGAGINYAPADIDMVAKECPFIADTLATGGAGLSEPLWKYGLSIACHTTDPEENAHRLSSGHHAYSQSETDEKLAQAQRDRQHSKKMGPPKCGAISKAGALQCKSCPNFIKGTTPISFGYGRNGHHYPINKHFVNDREPDLPRGYFRDKETQYICADVSDKNGNRDIIEVFPFPIIRDSGYLESHSPYQFVFTTIEAGREKQIKVNQPAMSSRERAPIELGSQGLSLNYKEATKDFFVGYLRKLHSQQATMINLPAIGWHQDTHGMGFAYAGSYYSPGGIQKCRLLPPEVSGYGIVGGANAWTELAGAVITRDRPDLSVLIAQGFAAPLVVISGHNGYLLGAWSTKSGVGKSTSLTLAQTIWGSPSEKNGLSDTEAHLFAKASTIKHLGIIVDEVKTVQQQGNFLNTIFQVTSGRDKARADRSGGMRATKDFQTTLTYATNASMIAMMEEKTKGSLATIFRVFEYQCLPNGPLQFSTSDISSMTMLLNHNYGSIGAKYAEFLGNNYEYVVKCIKYIQRKLEYDLHADQDERFWVAAIANTLAAAHFAKKLGVCNFHVTTIQDFLIAELKRMRQGKLVSPVDYSNVHTIVSELGVFLKEYRAKLTIITDTMITTVGQPKKGSVKVLNETPGIKKDGPVVQVSLNPYMLRVTDSALSNWCKLRNIPKASLVESLQEQLGAKKTSARIGSGTDYADMTQACWTIQIGGTPLEREVEYAEQFK